MNYHEYMQSEHWGIVREIAIRGARGKCRACGAESKLQAHHRFYRRSLLQTMASDLMCLCEPCHDAFHKLPKANRTLGASETAQLIRKARASRLENKPFDHKAAEEKWRQARRAANKRLPKEKRKLPAKLIKITPFGMNGETMLAIEYTV